MPPLHMTSEPTHSFLGGGIRAAVIRVVITAIAVFLAVMIVPGIEVDSLPAGLAAGLVLTILNLLVRPILFVLTLPLIVLSMGLFLIVVNALLLGLTAYLVSGFVISFVTMILNWWTSDTRPTEHRSFPQRPPKIINPGE
jgi:putative membrane protein